MLYQATEENIRTGHLSNEELFQISGIPVTVANLEELPHGQELLEKGYLSDEQITKRANSITGLIKDFAKKRGIDLSIAEEQAHSAAQLKTCFGYSEDIPTEIPPESVNIFYFDQVFAAGFLTANDTGSTHIKQRNPKSGIVFPGICEETIALPQNIKLMAKTCAILFCKQKGNEKDFLRTVFGDAFDEINLSSSRSALNLFVLIHELAHFQQAHLEQDGKAYSEHSPLNCYTYYTEAHADMVALAAFRGHDIEERIRQDITDIRQVGKAFNTSNYWHADVIKYLQRPRTIPDSYFDTCVSIRALHVLAAMQLNGEAQYMPTEEAQRNLCKTIAARSKWDDFYNTKGVQESAISLVDDYLDFYQNHAATEHPSSILTAMRQVSETTWLIPTLKDEANKILQSARRLNPNLIHGDRSPHHRPTPLAPKKRQVTPALC